MPEELIIVCYTPSDQISIRTVLKIVITIMQHLILQNILQSHQSDYVSNKSTALDRINNDILANLLLYT